MPWNKRTLALPASPPSVRLARDWVTSVLREIGRDELTESARLAVSELVTNAILHADPPMTVHVRGTSEHPRIEVTDQSLVPPQRRLPGSPGADDDRSWATMGRGLDLVASHSVRWGAEISANGVGKVVWFEPSVGTRDDAPADGELYTMDAALAERVAERPNPAELVTIRLLGMPVEPFSHLRRHFNELGRELRLLAITDAERYPLAVEFSETYLQVEFERRQVVGRDVLDRAMAEGALSVDLTYSAPPTAPMTMLRLNGLLHRVYDELTGKVLLAAEPSRDLVDLQDWYLGEFHRQVAGHEPTRWTGPLRFAPEREVS